MSLKNGENPSDQEWLKAAYKMLVGLVMVIVLRSTMFYFIMLIVMFYFVVFIICHHILLIYNKELN